MKKIQTWDRASGGEIVLMEKLHTEGWWGGGSFSWKQGRNEEKDLIILPYIFKVCYVLLIY